ncbi:MAG: MFS transporter [Bifidobacteriaceae bacterium]|jgi:MFS family permease|nr:MFS transporter [Bifidobacteriaceae bacterium]
MTENLEKARSAETRAGTGSNQFKLVLTIVVIEFVSGFTQGFYEPLIPKFGELLNVDASGLTLFNTIPTAIAALFVPILTRLGDIKGYRKILRIVISIVLVATLLIMAGVITESWAIVLVGRLLNGPIAVWLPLHIALVHAKTEGKSATSAVSAIIATLTVGTVAGTASAGFIFGAFGSLVQCVVIIPVLIFIAVLLVLFVMPEFVSGADSHIDAKGFVLLGAVMFVTIIGFVEIVEGGTESLIGGAALVIAGAIAAYWYRYEKRTEHPAIDVNVLFSRQLGPLYLGAICYGAVFYGFLAPLATFLDAKPEETGYGYGYDASAISITQTAILVMTVIAALALPLIINRIGAKRGLVAGFILGSAGFLEWAIFGTSIAKLALFVVLVGIGLGVISAAIPVIIPQRAPKGTHGIATGLFNSAQTLGGALGSGLFLSLLKVGATPDGIITATGYETVWFTCAGFLVIGLAVVVGVLAKE